MTYLLIKNGVVVNAIVTTAADAARITGYDQVIPHATAGPGWRYRDGVLSPPDPVTPPPSPLTQLAFLRRFTAEERIASRASADPVVQDFLHLLGLAQEIRLDDADTVAGVNYLESLGLLAAGRAAAVLA